MLSENARKVYDYLYELDGRNVTSTDIAEALNLGRKTVDAIVTSAFQKKGYSERIPAEIELADGSHKTVKFIRLTEAGREFDPDAPDPVKEDKE